MAVLNARMMIFPFRIARVIGLMSLPIPASWEILLKGRSLVAGFQSVADFHQ
jgi:hypothetical protein